MAFKGIDVKLTTKQATGETDEFGSPVFSTVTDTVHNVLVAPTSSDDIPTTLDITRFKVLYTLAIPKTDKHQWEGGTVEFWGFKWLVVGSTLQGMDELIPLEWNKKVQVARYE